VSPIYQNAAWWCDSDTPMRRPTPILSATRYWNPIAPTATTNAQTIKTGSSRYKSH